MSRQPLISVVIPTYGRPRFLREAIDSVFRQSVQDFECIVVDDASHEQPSFSSHPKVRFIRRDENRGPAAARNTGIQVARGRYLAFLDDDDVYFENRLHLALQGLEKAPISVCWSRYFAEAPTRKRILEGHVGDCILNDMTPNLGATAIEREMMESFDERFNACSDVEWWLRITQDLPVATVAEFGHVIRKHDTPRHMTNGQERIKGNMLLFGVHAPYFRSHRRGAAFRWKRVGLTAKSVGDPATARRAFVRSFAFDPKLKTVGHLLRTLG